MQHQIVADDILHFWFEKLKPAQWWKSDEALDLEIEVKYGKVHKAATLGELEQWRDNARGRLAEIIILDQFSRNIYRDTPLAFASDRIALVLAQEAIRQGADQQLAVEQRAFFYMPYMHSESKMIHEKAVELFSQPGGEFNYEYELQHKAIIDRFGRYPHRNKALHRTSTPEEIEYLKQPGSSF